MSLLFGNSGFAHERCGEQKISGAEFSVLFAAPKSIDDVMPFARAAVRQTGGRTPLSLVEKGSAELIVTEVGADPRVMQAIRRAYEERGVYVQLVPEYDLVGVSPVDARKAKEATRDYSSKSAKYAKNLGKRSEFIWSVEGRQLQL